MSPGIRTQLKKYCAADDFPLVDLLLPAEYTVVARQQVKVALSMFATIVPHIPMTRMLQDLSPGTGKRRDPNTF